MQEWRFTFVDKTEADNNEPIKSGVSNTLGSGVKEKAKKVATTDDTYGSEIAKATSEQVVGTFVVSPLNQYTGGMASPIYALGKSVVKKDGFSANAVGGFAAAATMIAIQKSIEYIQNRLATLEEKATNLNNADNVALRAGSVSKATYYSSNIWGIKSRTDRS